MMFELLVVFAFIVGGVGPFINRLTRTAAFSLYLLSFPLQVIEFPASLEQVLVFVMLALIVTSSVARLIAHRFVAAPHRERDGTIMLRGVHLGFVRAVQEARRDARPATMADKP